jgi:hypothetical protein
MRQTCYVIARLTIFYYWINMFTVETVIASALVYLLMLFAAHMHKHRMIHIPAMSFVMIFDLLMPVYLYMNRDWEERLIDGGEILSFAISMHVGLVLTLYAMYAMQISEGRKLLRGKKKARAAHKNQAMGIMAVRLMVVLTGAILYEPEVPEL